MDKHGAELLASILDDVEAFSRQLRYEAELARARLDIDGGHALSREAMTVLKLRDRLVTKYGHNRADRELSEATGGTG